MSYYPIDAILADNYPLTLNLEYTIEDLLFQFMLIGYLDCCISKTIENISEAFNNVKFTDTSVISWEILQSEVDLIYVIKPKGRISNQTFSTRNEIVNKITCSVAYLKELHPISLKDRLLKIKCYNILEYYDRIKSEILISTEPNQNLYPCTPQSWIHLLTEDERQKYFQPPNDTETSARKTL